MPNLRQTLYAWRDNEATKRGVEVFRILPNSSLDEIVKALPRTKDELTSIKGIKDAKYQQYGKVILSMIDSHVEGGTKLASSDAKPEIPVLSVSGYLDIVNNMLWRLSVRVQGEITSVKFQGNAVYFCIKDKEDDSILNVFMWNRDYELSGIEIEDGLEVIIDGRSEIYKPNGRFTFKAQTIELVGEGAWKKAYEALKKKLDTEGLFSIERKRELPDFPETIGLITSEKGAVIHDFLNNLGKFGYKIRFHDSRVEGAAAIKDLLRAIEHFHKEHIDALVIVRGGGSLESLQAFNNEHVVRAIATFPVPVICAIGHDKDVPLAQLVADHSPSTPTACTILLNRSWEEGVHTVRHFTRDIVSLYQDELWINKDRVRSFDDDIRSAFVRITRLFDEVSREFFAGLSRLERSIASLLETFRSLRERIESGYRAMILAANRELTEGTRMLRTNDPLRQLKLGYSILSKGGKIIRNADDIAPGESFEAKLSDGTLRATREE